MSKRPDFQFSPAPSGAKVFWRSLEEKEQPDLHAQRAKAEFPEGVGGAEDAVSVSRRGFLALAGAGATLLGLEGCIRRPAESILPYSQAPEYLNPGTPLHYATVVDRLGEAVGVLANCYEGRPTKLEGNPDHPSSQGMTDLHTQAAMLDLYDPDRAAAPSQDGHRKTFHDVDALMQSIIDKHTADQGAGLRLLVQPTTSPTFRRLREALRMRFVNARLHTWSPVNDDNVREGARIAFGRPLVSRVDYRTARVIVSIDHDFLQTAPGVIRHTRSFADGRRLDSSAGDMSRLYMVESGLSTTGASADHRLALPPSRIEAYLRALAAHLAREQRVDLGEVGQALAGASSQRFPPRSTADLAADPKSANEKCFVAESDTPADVHALAHAVNAGLGSLGTTVMLYPAADEERPPQGTDLEALVDDLGVAGRVTTLLVLGGNPAHDAPADLGFAEKLHGVELSVAFSARRDETGKLTKWHVPRAHELETWGDQRATDGTLAIQQPLIAPLFGGRSDIEVLGQLAGVNAWRGHYLVRQTLRGVGQPGAASLFENEWRRILHRGVVPGTGSPPVQMQPDRVAIQGALQRAPAPAAAAGIELVFTPCPKLHDGRHANNQWLLEMPDPLTRIVWDNAALVSPKTARDLGVVADGRSGGMVDVVRITKGDAHVEAPVWAVPGMADGVVALSLGWGRTEAGRYATGLDRGGRTDFENLRFGGFDFYPLRTSDGLASTSGAQVAKTGSQYRIVRTQEHDAMEGRPIALDASLEAYKADPTFAAQRSPTPRTLPLWREVEYKGHKWGLTIDLNACTGCNTCVVACQAENNIPTVGKRMVRRGREMHWIRIDRYFTGEADNPEVAFQPLGCQQCEEAPCENVCPVNATAHSPEGLNDMSYNRCIGTRYCANNCPYKVRRFNYLNWHVWKEETDDVPETLQMQFNPNVTVRTRGVMEKCTYCVQRIETARIATRIAGRALRDGDIDTACAQACPAGAIVFGDLNDTGSRVAHSVQNDRRYKLLGDVGTQPRTTYLAKIRNPNPRMGA